MSRPAHPVPYEQRIGTYCEEYEQNGCPVQGCPQACYHNRGGDPWLINDRIKAAAIRWFGVSERAAAGFGAFLCGELGLTHECRYEPLGAGIPTAHRWVTRWEPTE